MTNKSIISIISIYKLTTSYLRIIAGVFLFYFGLSIANAGKIIFRRELVQDPTDFLAHFLMIHIRNASPILTGILASSLIVLSLLDIFFIFAIALRKRWGVIGLFIVSISWIPIEVLFISRFLIISRTLGIIIDLIIIYLLYRIITHPKGYFKN